MPGDDSIEALIAHAVAPHVPLAEQDLEGLLLAPPSPEMGDYGLPCFELARAMKRSPAQVAAELSQAVQPPPGVLRIEAAGPYLNFFVDRASLARQVLGAVHRLGSEYGASDLGAGRTVVIDYGSPNIAKHLGVHHLPSAAIGSALCRIYRRLGYRCVGINYLGDWGTSFGRLIAAVERYGVAEPERLSVSDLQELYVRFSGEAEGKPALQEAAREAFRRLEEGDPEARRIWASFRHVSLKEFERLYRRLGVSFDLVTPESQYVERVGPTLGRMLAAGVAVESDGALIVPLQEEGMPPCMVRKSDGASLYASRDIAAAMDRWERFRFEKCLYVHGNEQSLYFNQLRAVLKKMGMEWSDRIVHVNFGLIKFRDPETGRAVVGSTRRGQMLLLEELLDEALERARRKIEANAERFDPDADLQELAACIGIGAVIFSELSVRRTHDVVFDWDRMLDFEGASGPYAQYAHARLCSILRKAGEPASPEADCSRLKLPQEWQLVRLMSDYPRCLRRAAQENEPSVLASYLLDFCAVFSAYYSEGMRRPERRVLCPDAEVRRARLLLVDAARHLIRSALELLGLEAPERM